MEWTKEQEKAISLSATLPKGSVLLVNAVAGSGKSTLLKGIAKASPSENILFLAFNKAIQEHFSSWSLQNVACFTLNAYALYIIKTRLDIDEIDDDAFLDLIKTAFGTRHFNNYIINMVSKVISLYLNNAFAFQGGNELRNIKNIFDSTNIHLKGIQELEFLQNCQKVLKAILASDSRCFTHDHCIHLAVQEIKRKPWETAFDKILIDEFQDLSELNLEFLDCLVRAGRSSIILTGDTGQGIYAFRGASLSVMTDIVLKYKPTITDMTYCFRCSVDVCEIATKYRRLPVVSFSQKRSVVSYRKKNETIHCLAEKFKDGKIKTLACLHRLNKPLQEIFIELLKENIPCYLSDENYINWLFKTESPERRVLMSYCSRNGIAPDSFSFKTAVTQGKYVRLSTIHSSKGTEFDYVFMFMPSAAKYMTVDDKMQLENAKYVAVTRSKGDLDIVEEEENESNPS